MERLILLALLTTCLFIGGQGHVKLTFPPARYFQLEYLDVYRHSPPCGMVRTSATPHTTFLQGSTFTVTWHLSWPHKGGAKIDIIQEEGGTDFRVLADLTAGFVYADDTTAQAVEVTLPDGLVCDNCTLRLTRQGAEYGRRYGFYSCGDITILPSSEGERRETPQQSNTGGNQGQSSCTSSNPDLLEWLLEIVSEVDSGRRRMDPRTYNYILDYITQLTPSCTTTAPPPTNGLVASAENLSDTTCYEGKCLHGGTCDEATGQCQCHRLFTGSRCQYQDECWTDEDCNYNGECIDTRSTSYPKLVCYCEAGWFGKECEKESQITEILDDYENNPNYLSAELRRGIANMYWRYVANDTQIEIVVRVTTTSWVGVGWKPVGIRSNCKITDPADAVQARLERAQQELLERQSNYTTTEPNPHRDPEIDIENTLGSNIESQCKRRGKRQAGSSGVPHFFRVYAAMDCSDIVIGAVKGGLYRIYDTYTNDRETPYEDAFYGGRDDLTSAMGTQVDGVTTIAFRKPVTATHYTDHSFTQNRMTVIWARGQETNNYRHYPSSGLEACTSSDPKFYRHDELKFHGSSSQQKGATTLTFTRPTPPPAAGSCDTESGSIMSPTNCQAEGSGFNCSYFVSWQLQGNQIMFSMKAPLRNQNMYIALGISEDRFMPDTDIYSGWIDSRNEVVLLDRFATARSFPLVDASQDYTNVAGSYQNGVITIQFTRPRSSSNGQDEGFSGTNCRHFLIATGPLVDNDISYHSFREAITDSPVCIRPCGGN